MRFLSDLRKDKEAVIKEFDRENISDSQITELLELGFYPGARVQCIDISRTLDKMLLSLGGTKVGLRIADCQYILVHDL